MTINYEKLWNMLDAQGISKDQLRKAAGLTTYVLDAIRKEPKSKQYYVENGILHTPKDGNKALRTLV